MAERIVRLRDAGTYSTYNTQDGETWLVDATCMTGHKIQPFRVKGINQHRAYQRGRCTDCGRTFRREIDWFNRSVSGWQEADDG